MKENYHIVKAENGYLVEVYCEDNINDCSHRKMIVMYENDFREFMTKTIMAELKNFGSLNVTMDYL